MTKQSVNPAELEGPELERWYRRTPDDVEGERRAARQDAYDAYFSEGGAFASPEGHAEQRWEQAFYEPPARPAVRSSPVRPATRVAPSVSPNVPSPGRAGFFSGRSPTEYWDGPAYVSNLPRPLNDVRPRFGGWFELGDGSLVPSAAEVDRLYAEQQDRMSGSDGLQPAIRVRSVDRLPDGRIPAPAAIAKGEREIDSTCHPFGAWEWDAGFDQRPERTRRYETQVTRAPGLDYVVRNPGKDAVKFDGCAVWTPGHELLEAKGPGYESLLAKAGRSTFFKSVSEKQESQVNRQIGASGGRTTEWHVAEPGAMEYFRSKAKAPIRVELTLPK